MITLAVWVSLALATQVEQGTLPCPIGGAPTRVHRLVGRNLAGWDADGARYATGGQWRSFAIATCPDNLLSLYSDDMVRPLSPEQQAALAPLLAALKAEVTDPDALQLWDRYALAARAYEALGRDPWFLANVLVRGSWTVRDAITGESMSVQGPAMARTSLVQGDAALLTALEPAQRKVLLFNLARLAHRAGLATEREGYVAALQKLGPFTAAEQQALTALVELPAVEAHLQDLALAQLDHVPTTDHDLDVQVRFLRAELLRRRGHPDAARIEFGALERDPEAPDAIREISAYLRSELAGERPWDRKKPVELEAPKE